MTASTLDVSQTGCLVVEFRGMREPELVASVADVVPTTEDEAPDVAAEVDPTPVDVWLDEWATDEPGPLVVVPFNTPEVVDKGGVTSAVVVAEIEIVLPETGDPGPVEEVFPVVAASIVCVVWGSSLSEVEAEDVPVLDSADPVWDPMAVLLPVEEPDAEYGNG
jgi:hypothetical protein